MVQKRSISPREALMTQIYIELTLTVNHSPQRPPGELRELNTMTLAPCSTSLLITATSF